MGYRNSPTPKLEQLEPRLLLSTLTQLLESATAIDVATPTQLDISGSVVLPREVDMYQFTTEATSSFIVDMLAEGGTIDPYLWLCNAGGRYIRGNNNAYRGTLDSQIAYTLDPGQTYYLRAQSLGRTAGDYRIQLQTTLVDEYADSLEEADTVALSRGGSRSLRAIIDHADDVDVIRFVATRTGRMTVGQFPRSRWHQVDCELTVYDAEGGVLTSNAEAETAAERKSVSLDVTEGQVYYLKVTAASDGATGRYALRIATRPPRPDRYGDAFEAARLLRLSRYGGRAVHGEIGTGTDVDVTQFVSAKSGEMQVVLSRLWPESFNCVVSAYDAGGNLLATNVGDPETDPAGVIHFDVAEGQLYYLSVSGQDKDVGRYRLSITTEEAPAPIPPPEPDPEPTPDPDPPMPILPGSEVAGYALSTTGGMQLLVLGTDGADEIVVNQTAEGITLVSDDVETPFSGAFANVVVYGFGGDDVIRVMNSVTAAETVYGGDGSDWIFDAGMGAGLLYGGAGDDLLVTVGGSVDRIYGGAGLDSFWFDGTDQVADASAAENAATSVHRITAFYQPYTYDSRSHDYVSLEIAGQEIRDPTLTAYATGYENFSDEPVFVDGPDYNDIVQGALGDCYLLASLSALAQSDPLLIEQMVTPLGDGTFAVRFYNSTTPVYLRVDGDLPIWAPSVLAYADLGPNGDMWVALVEKAYAYYRYGDNSYGSLHGGWMSDVCRQVTGATTIYRYTSGLGSYLCSFLAGELAAGHAVTMGSWYSASTPIVGSHAYVVQDVNVSAGTVTVYNPWGVDGRTWDSNYSDGLLTISAAQVAQYFSAIVSCYA